MPISYLGYDQADASAGDGSDATITIPSGATVAILTCQFWDDTSTQKIASFTLDSQSGVEADSATAQGGHDSAGYLGYVTGFATGASKTLAWTWVSDEVIFSGGEIYLTFWSGVDLTSPIRFSDVVRDTGAATEIQAIVTSAASDVVLVQSQRFENGGSSVMSADGSPSINSVVNEEVNSDYRVNLDYFARTQTPHVIDLTNENYSGIIAAVLRVAPAITSVSTDDIIGVAENPWNITGTGFGDD